MKTGFIGAGKTGSAMAVGLSRIGYQISAVCSHSFASAQRLSSLLPDCHACQQPQEVADASDLVFITTPDDVIPNIAEQIRWRRGQYVLHCSGAILYSILHYGSLWPLFSYRMEGLWNAHCRQHIRRFQSLNLYLLAMVHNIA